MLRVFLSRGRRWSKLLLVSWLLGGSFAAHAVDTYDPATGILTIPMVIVGGTAYLNVQVFVGASNPVVGGGTPMLAAADTYDGAVLTIPAVQVVGGNVYANVQVAVGLPNVRGVGGSTPKPASAPLLTLVDPLPNATVGQAYATTIPSAVYPIAQYTYAIDTLANGVLPSGMTIDLNGRLSGTPFATGRTDINGHQIANTYTFGVCATDTFTRVTTSPCPQTSITVNPAPVTLTIATVGTGSGTVVSVPSAISCRGSCSATAPYGTSGSLTAVPDSGSVFAGWSGACTNTTGSCALTLTAATSVAATFNIDQSQVKSDAVTPGAVSLGKAGSCTGGTLSTTFQVLAPTGITWTAAADPNTPPLGDRPLGIAPSSGSGSGNVVVTITVPPQLPSSSFSSCSLQYFLDTFSNMYVTFSDGTVIGVTVYWTFVGTT
jgi:hypothetical protein